MFLKDLTLKNFMSYKDVSLSGFNSKGLIGVVSKDTSNSNGVGKTNLIYNSVIYGLTGNIPMLNLDNLIRINENEMVVTLNLSNDKETFKVIRNRFRGDPFANSLYIFENGKNLVIKNQKHSQQYINNKLNTSYDNFLIFNKITDFMSQSKTRQVEIIESLYNNINWEKLYLNCLERIKTITTNISVLSEKIEIFKNSSLSSIYQDKLQQIQTTEKEILSIQENLKILQEKYDSQKFYIDQYNELLNNKALIEGYINNLKKLEGTPVCPTCFNEIDLNKMRSIIESKNKELDSVVAKLKQLEKVAQDIENLEKEILNNNQQLTVLSSTLQYAQSELNKLQTLLNEQTINLNVSIRELEENKENLEFLNYLKEYIIKKGSPFRISFIKRYLEILNKLINKYLNQLEIKFACVFDLENNEEITTKFDIPIDYHMFSSGQKKLFDVCLTLSLFDLYKAINKNVPYILIFDEFLNYLDSYNESLLLHLLDNYSHENNVQIFVISPRPLNYNNVQYIIVDYNKELNESNAYVV